MVSSITHSTFTPDAYNDLPPPEEGEGEGEGGGYNAVQKALIGLILAFTISVGALGNLLVCIVVRSNPHMRKKSNSFIASLAVADISIALLVKTFALYSELNDDRWPFGAVFCRVWISLDIMCCTASILHLCLISMDRYVHIRCPITYDRWMTKRKVVTSIAAVWVTSALLSFVPTHLGCHTHPESAPHGDVCLFDIDPVYALGSSLVSFYVPCVVLLVIYSRLFAYARRHTKKLRELTPTPRLTPTKASVRLPEPYYDAVEMTVTTTTRTGSVTTVVSEQGCAVQPFTREPLTLGTTTSSDSKSPGTRGRIRRWFGKRSDHKAAITVGVIMGAFLVCWLPFFIVNPIAAYHPRWIAPLLMKIVIWFGWFNSCLNPLIYSVTDTTFRKAFHRLLCLRRC